MKPETGESPESSQETAGTGRTGARSTEAVALGAFALGALAGAVVTIGLLLIGRGTFGSLEIGKPRPRRLLIGNLEIEERGDDTRFRVEKP
ncbi:MAG TPA: hypothetical protein VHY09_06775 [Candidatus Methylacidiphilales bacterium]|jgi:hypothetical protein|nr:hypothetical protein [Candidatus Methylacidiphilales bacterium]